MNIINEIAKDTDQIFTVETDESMFVRLHGICRDDIICRMSCGLISEFSSHKVTVEESLRWFRKAMALFAKYPEAWLVVTRPERKISSAMDDDGIILMPAKVSFYCVREINDENRVLITFLLSSEY